MVPSHSSPSGAVAAADSRPYRFWRSDSGAPVNVPLSSGRSTNTERAPVCATSSSPGCATHPATPGRSGQVQDGSPSAPGFAR